MSTVAENTILVSDKAKAKVKQLMLDAEITNDSTYFLRVGVVGGGCSGLSYKLDFDNEVKPMDQVFEDNGVKVVTDLKSFLYLVNTELDFSDGLNGKKYTTSGSNVIPNTNDPLTTSVRLGPVYEWSATGVNNK